MDQFLSACGWTVYAGFLFGTVTWFAASFEAVRTVGLTTAALWNLSVCFLTLYSCLALLILKLSWTCGLERGLRPLILSLLTVLGPVILSLSLLGLATHSINYEPVCGAFFESPALTGTVLTTCLLVVSTIATISLVFYCYFEYVWRPHLSHLQQSLQPLDDLSTHGKHDAVCAVCLERCNEDQQLGQLRRCHHVFHRQCIDDWIAYNPRCPVCRVVV